jgi:phospholipid/cholesterol/gamma-HCH transport system substrate-binding protein
MIFGKTKMELKVGIFVFMGMVILTIFILSIGNFSTWASGYRVNFIFNFVNGIKIGAPVRFSGFDVGEVKKIDFIDFDQDNKDEIQVQCWVKGNVKIPIDSTIWINTLGLLGEKYVEIMAGEDYSRFLAENKSLVGIDPIPMHEVFRLGKNITENLNEGIMKINKGEGTIGRLLHDDSIYKEVETLLKEIEVFVLDIQKHPWKLFWKQKEKPTKK